MVDTSRDDAPPAPKPPGGPRPLPDFSDTEETFRHLSDGELREATWLFEVMGREWLSDLLSGIGTRAVRWGLPFAKWGVRRTIYRQFVGGTGLGDARPTIARLHERGVTSILDYGVEAKSTEEDFEAYRRGIVESLEFCGRTPAANSIAIKITGLAPNGVLAEFNDRSFDLAADLDPRLASVVDRVDSIARAAAENGVQLNIDAEESWYQNTIDAIADAMMRRYNADRPIVLNTFQLYRHDRLQFLRDSDERARESGYVLGAKLVRGAYMDKERARARERGDPSPIQPDLAATHRDFDAAVRHCIDNIGRIGCVIGSHNENSMREAAALMDRRGIRRDHPYVTFAQLLGMSDNLTFNLAAAGFNAAKYLVYGPVEEVLPYLVRRAEENNSVTGELGRELRLLRAELRRRRQAR